MERRIASVKNTRKITRAMKLVSTAKLTRAQEAVTRSRDYSSALGTLLQQLSAGVDLSTVSHPLMQPREEIRNIRIVVVGASKGLCGAYNTNLNKRTDALIRQFRKDYPQAVIDGVLVGKKPAEFFRRVKHSYSKSYEKLPENPNLWPIQEVCEDLEKDYSAEKIDLVYLVYTRFKSIMTQQVMAEKLLPFAVETEAGKGDAAASSSVTKFEPSAAKVFEALIPRLMGVKIRQACLDAKASEHANRMTAMDSATKNAGELIDDLTLTYNRLRQSGITAELLDIVGGAEAVSQGE